MRITNMDTIERTFEDALQISIGWAPSLSDIENKAIEIATLTGRDWSDCGEYEKQSFRDAAQQTFETDQTPIIS